MGQKDVNPLFKLPRLPAEAVKDLAEQLSEFDLPVRTLDAELIDEFHSLNSEIHHQGRDHRSSISSEPLIIPKTCQVRALQQVQKTVKMTLSSRLSNHLAQLGPVVAAPMNYLTITSK